MHTPSEEELMLIAATRIKNAGDFQTILSWMRNHILKKQMDQCVNADDVHQMLRSQGGIRAIRQLLDVLEGASERLPRVQAAAERAAEKQEQR